MTAAPPAPPTKPRATPSATAHPAPHLVRVGTGVPLIFVHGNGVDHRLMLPFEACFVPADAAPETAPSAGWERIYVDLPGFGDTPALGDSGGLPGIADWLDTLVGEIAGEGPFALVGNSLGGLLAREIAARRLAQCVGLALIAPVVDPRPSRRDVPARQVALTDTELMASLPADAAAEYAEMAVRQTPENWRAFAEFVLPGLRAADQAAMARLAREYALAGDTDDRLTGFTAPVLIVTGKQDAVVGYLDQWALAERLPHATYVALDGAGHNVHLDRPEEVYGLVAAWAGEASASARRS